MSEIDESHRATIHRSVEDAKMIDDAGDAPGLNQAVEGEAPESPAPELSEDALAKSFVVEHHSELRYVTTTERWLIWQGGVWRHDRKNEVLHRVRLHCRKHAIECRQDKTAKLIASLRTIRAVEILARADPRIAMTEDQLDVDLYLLNTPAGTFDLRRMEMREHRASDFITRMTGVAPGGDCPKFRAFLSRILPEDDAAFLQRVFGYSLSGSTKEHAIFFLFGEGGNGKSLLINLIARVLGDYHATGALNTFAASKYNQIPADVASLKGSRMASISETSEDVTIDDAKLKQMSGGDRVKVRFLRGNFFEYTPEYKIFILGNKPLNFSSIDRAIRRRLHVVEFKVNISDEERDTHLEENIAADELPGILQWMLDGYEKYVERGGLVPSEAISSATKDFIKDQDFLKRWIDECCELDSSYSETTTKLTSSYNSWAKANGAKEKSSVAVGIFLARRFTAIRDNIKRGYVGLRLRQSSDFWGKA